MSLAIVIRHLAPEANFGYRGDPTTKEEYNAALMWHGPGEAPSWEDVQAAWDEAHQELAMRDLRYERNALLSLSDWTQMPDASVDSKSWALYRQQLRDFPATVGDLTKPIVWPTAP
jgi:hypothetical protein